MHVKARKEWVSCNMCLQRAGNAVGRTAKQPEASEGAPQKYIIFVCTIYNNIHNFSN